MNDYMESTVLSFLTEFVTPVLFVPVRQTHSNQTNKIVASPPTQCPIFPDVVLIHVATCRWRLVVGELGAEAILRPDAQNEN